MEHLYVCHFSNGFIKVGRSSFPAARIAQHESRVSCVGIELIEHHVFECVGYPVPAESALVTKCIEHATGRAKSEWFEGLDYLEVCEWAQAAAMERLCVGIVDKQQTGIEQALEMFDGSPTRLANAIGGTVLRQHVEHWIKARRVPADKAPDVELATGIPCEALCPEVNWGVVRRNGATDLNPEREARAA